MTKMEAGMSCQELPKHMKVLETHWQDKPSTGGAVVLIRRFTEISPRSLTGKRATYTPLCTAMVNINVGSQAGEWNQSLEEHWWCSGHKEEIKQAVSYEYQQHLLDLSHFLKDMHLCVCMCECLW